jgi:hypothetical protein
MAADARISSPPLESQGVLLDGSEREDGRESTYTYLLRRTILSKPSRA